MLNNIISDLKNLEGKLVGKGGYFEHIYINKEELDTISTIEILEGLKPYELESFEIYNYENEEADEIIEVSADEFLELEEYEEVNCNNSYNWDAPLTNHIDYRIYKSLNYEGIIVELKVHRYGDVRCNYTENCYLQFDEEYEFYEVLSESSKYFIIKDNNNNIEYEIRIDVLNGCPEIIINTKDEEEYIEGYEAIELLENLIENIEKYELL